MITPAMTINGKSVPVSETFDVINPSTEKACGRAPSCTAEQLDAAMNAAQEAFASWRLDDDVRRQALHQMASVLESNAPALATALTSEQGKPLNWAHAEIRNSCRWLRYSADVEIPIDVRHAGAGEHLEVLRRPLGVVAGIAPWNFPVTLAVWKIAPALRTGNTMVLKPSPYTPLTTLMLGELLQDVLPPGVLNVISGPDPLGAAMVDHPTPRKVSFTGSTATGKRVAAAAAPDLKRLTLELGGNDAAIILDDADIDAISTRLFWSAFRNAGQICNAVKRVYAPASVYGQVVEAMAAIARTVRVGDGFDESSEMGPVNNQPQYHRVAELIDQAVGDGADVAAGGRTRDGAGYFIEPTVLANLRDGSRIIDEEQFGPALPVMAYDTLDEAVRRANASHYGLTSSVWGKDTERAQQVATQLDCGQVTVNCHGMAVRPDVPFGGHKWSGVGVENGLEGLLGFTEPQVLLRVKH
jgi:acyl-CoA reductase-like NAD-dependent aldehyde dehydrogenase